MRSTDDPRKQSSQAPRWWTALAVLGLILLLQALSAVFCPYIVFALESYNDLPASSVPWFFVSQRLADRLLIVPVLLLALRLGRKAARETLSLRMASPRAFAAVVVMILALAPWEALLHVPAPDRPDIETTAAAPLLVILAFCGISILVTPLVEEALFRGYLFTALKARSLVVGILGSAVLFALWHFDPRLPLIACAAHLPFGLAAAYSVALVRSLYPVVAAHALWNLCVAVGFGPTSLPPTPLVLACSGAIVAGCAVALHRSARAHRTSPFRECK